MADQPKTECAVRGLIPGFGVCPRIIVGGMQFCGRPSVPCNHQQPPVTAAEAELQEMREHGNADDAMEAAAHLERVKRGWCNYCGCGNDAAGYAHLPSCRRPLGVPPNPPGCYQPIPRKGAVAPPPRDLNGEMASNYPYPGLLAQALLVEHWLVEDGKVPAPIVREFSRLLREAQASPPGGVGLGKEGEDEWPT